MIHPKGTKIRVTEIQRKDFEWFDNEFEEMSARVNGKEGKILNHLEAIPEFNEREAYMVSVNGEEFEIEEDEFVLV